MVPLARFCATIVLLLSCNIFAGCAYVTAVPVSPHSQVEGIRIYEAKPILIVTGETATVQVIPNYNRAYALRFGAFLAKHNFSADFNNAMLVKLTSDQDTTKIIDLLGKVAERLLPGTGTSSNTNGGAPGRFGVYDFVFDDAGNLVALRPLLDARTLSRVPQSHSSRATGANPPTPGAPRAGQPADSVDVGR